MLGIPKLTGIADELNLFLSRMEESHSLITTNNLDEGMKRTILGYKLSRVELGLLLDLAVTSKHSWNKVKNSLMKKFGGLKKLVTRNALELAIMKIN